MFKRGQVHAPALEPDTFPLQQKALFQSRFPGEGDAPTRSQDPLPGQSGNLLQHAGHMAGAAGIAGRRGDRAIRTDSSPRNTADGIGYRQRQRLLGFAAG